MKRLAALLAACALLAPAAVQAADAPSTVSLVFAGDITLDDDAGRLIARGGDPFAAFAPAFRAADIRIGNLESVVATGGAPVDKVYTFRAHPRVLPVLRRHFDAVSLANNHSGDFGRAAFAEMLGHLQRHGLAYFGGGHHLRQAHAPLIVERRGLRVALLGYNEFQPRSFEADHDAPGVAWSEDEQVVADIRRARDVHGAQVVIPVMHWGWENEAKAGRRQRQLARTMIDAGADVVLGGHPHVRQDVEHYRGRPIIYSVGNFVMKETDNPEQRLGWLLRLQLDAQGVQAFDTRVAQLDRRGIPRPLPDAEGPCWRRGEEQVRMCRVRD